jgi:hypothetical protein
MNEHLDELNAYAQALRARDRQLGYTSFNLPGRPYELCSGDHVQIRHTVPLPDGRRRNGTTAVVKEIDPRAGRLSLELTDGSTLAMNRDQIEQPDLRLASGATYVATHHISSGGRIRTCDLRVMSR